jgi:hypothetical protein
MKEGNGWMVSIKLTTRKDEEEYLRGVGENPEKYEIEDFQDVEISVVRKSNKHGFKSYGWADLNKIILFSNLDGPNEYEINWCKKVAELVCYILNENDM